MGFENFRNVNLAVVCLDNLSLGLQRSDNLENISLFLLVYIVNLVEDDGCAEFNLLDKQVFNIFLVKVFVKKA